GFQHCRRQRRRASDERLPADAGGVSIQRNAGLAATRAGAAALAGDVCERAQPGYRETGWLFGLSRRGATVLNGDRRPSYLLKDRLEAVATYQVPFTRSLEDWTLSDTSLLAATV